MFKFMVLFVGLVVGGFASTIRNTWPSSQYHNQDSLGSYHYGYTSPYHSKSETRTNGITQGGYSYIDANGILQAVQYTADDVNGFRISGSNIPKQIENNNLQVGDTTTEIAESHENHISKFNNNNNNENTVGVDDINRNNNNYVNNELIKNPYLLTKAEASNINVPIPFNNYLINNKKYGYYDGLSSTSKISSSSSSSLPQPPSPASSVSSGTLPFSSSSPSTEFKTTQPAWIVPSLVPVSSTYPASSFVPASSTFIPASPLVPVYKRLMHSSLHHIQDSLGQYDYSYTGDTSAKSESRSLDGTTRGAYSYIDANGILQQVHYIADHNGFRVLATNLPS